MPSDGPDELELLAGRRVVVARETTEGVESLPSYRPTPSCLVAFEEAEVRVQATDCPGAIGTAAVAALVLAAGLGGAPASCAPTCDCETIGSGVIAQPANAWTALAIVAAGVWAGARRPVPGVLIAMVGASAFAAHATVAEWAYRLEGAVLAGAAWSAVLGAGTRSLLAGLAAAGIAWLLPDPGAVVAAGVAVAVFLVAPAARRIPPRVGVPALTLLSGGLVVRWLSDDGGVWCRPGAWLPGHAVWHLAAAAGLLLVAGGLAARSAPASPGSVIPSSPARRITEPSDDQKR